MLKEDNRKYLLRLVNNSFSKKKGYHNQIWQRENYSVLIESDWFFRQKLEYIHDNPVVEGYVQHAEDWLFSSARNYYNDDHSIIKVITDLY